MAKQNIIDNLPTVCDIEEMVLCAFLHGENARKIVEMGITPQMFSNLEFAEIFEAGVHLLRSGVEVDSVIIAQQLRNQKSNIKPLRLAEIYGQSATFINLKQWIQQLREYYGRRQLIIGLKNSANDLSDTSKIAKEVFDNLQKLCVKNEDLLKVQGNLPTTEQADQYLESLHRLQNPKTNGTGVIVPWGIRGLDELCPLQRKQIFVLGAGVNTGKTRFALSDLAGTLFSANPQPKVIFSKENPNRVIWDGLVSIISGVSAYNLNVVNGLNKEQYDKVLKAVDFLKSKFY